MTTVKTVTADEAVAAIKPGMRVRFPVGHSPMFIADALAARLGDLTSIEVTHTAAVAPFSWFGPGFDETFSVVQEHWAAQPAWPMMRARAFDYMPGPFSLRFKALHEGRTEGEARRANVVCIQTSPPDERGMVNLGRSIWDVPSYVRCADLVLAEIVPDMPIMCGDGELPADLITHFVEPGTPGSFLQRPEVTDAHRKIAEHLAPLINDGDTLQIGTGTASLVAEPLLELLSERNDLGWHSESTQFAVPELIRRGVLTSKRIPSHPGVAVSASWPFRDEDRDIMERNPAVQGWEIGKVTNPRTVAAIPNFKAMNSVMMIDLTGQAAAESIGVEMMSGVGGLLEFMIGALWSEGGRSILVSLATGSDGKRSKIVSTLPEGTQVASPRTLVDTVVTEYGVARLLGRTARERATELIRISDPKFRDQLEADSKRLFYS